MASCRGVGGSPAIFATKPHETTRNPLAGIPVLCSSMLFRGYLSGRGRLARGICHRTTRNHTPPLVGIPVLFAFVDNTRGERERPQPCSTEGAAEHRRGQAKCSPRPSDKSIQALKGRQNTCTSASEKRKGGSANGVGGKSSGIMFLWIRFTWGARPYYTGSRFALAMSPFPYHHSLLNFADTKPLSLNFGNVHHCAFVEIELFDGRMASLVRTPVFFDLEEHNIWEG